jgi:SAM-dependent methyltransferase
MMPVLESDQSVEAAPNFDRLARTYRWMEAVSFGPWLGRCRCAFLGEMTAARRALVLGDGDGRFTAHLLRGNPSVQVDAVDISPAMLDALMGRAGENASRVRVQVADARNWSPAGDGRRAYELVATHFFLDCLTTPAVEALADKVRALTSNDAMWVVSEFAIPAGWFGGWVAVALIGFLYRAFGLMTGLRVRTLPDHATALKRAGFQLVGRRNWLGGLLVSECWRVSGSARIGQAEQPTHRRY